MNTPQPTVSVIIPSHNRSHSLRRTLDALQTQDCPRDQIEVVVVADDCSDDTATMVRGYQAPFNIQLLVERLQSAAMARNCGARQARGQLLLFLDDDIEPTPTLVAAHLHAHMGETEHAVIGPYPPLPKAHPSLFRLLVRYWWEQKFNALRQPGHRFSYMDLLTGNLSLSAALFGRLGGFDPAFRKSGGEDYEFGLRLIKADIALKFAPDALAYHHEHETMSLDGAFRRAYNEGHTDVLMGQRHPEIRPLLELFLRKQRRSPRQRLLEELIFRAPTLADRMVALPRAQLVTLERHGMRPQWLTLYRYLRAYWYWRGVADELKSRKALAAYVQESWRYTREEPISCSIDLRAGLEAAEQRLDLERPRGARIYYGERLLGTLPAHPWAERLRGVHLRPFLAGPAAPRLIEALVLEGRIMPTSLEKRHTLARLVRRVARWYGPTPPHEMWWEQLEQWEEFLHDRAAQQNHAPYAELAPGTVQ